jgi:predicted metal-dependent hydrolase
MAVKKIELAGIGAVTLVKSPRSRSLRLSVTASGVRVSMPMWTPFSAGSAFALSQSDWIAKERAKQNSLPLEAGQRIGKLHYLRFEQALGNTTLTCRVTGTEVVVRMSAGEQIEDADVQARARSAGVRALKREAELLLPPRLANLAAQHGLQYTDVRVKSLKRRWGSCSSTQNIALNLFLMELSWEFIDYVLCHELTHTKHMNHGPDFWRMLTTLQPRARDISHQLHTHQPQLGNW